MPNWKKIALSGSNPEFSSLTVDGAIEASKFSGSFSGSYQGDGSELTGLSLSQVATVSDTFTSATSKTVTHNFGTKNVIVQVYDNDDNIIIPKTITTTDTNTVDITLDSSTTGRVVVAKGGHIVSGSVHFDNISNTPTLVSSSAQVVASLNNQDVDLGTGDITAVTASIDYALVNDTLQGNGSGFQFFAYNEDTVKVKFANWYSSNDRQYGMGQLWFETWFAAIDNGVLRDNRRIGFYLEEPDAGASDADGGGGAHPSNARFYVDINGAYLSGSLQATGGITGSSFTGSFVGDGSGLTGITADGAISSSAQIVALGANIVSSSAQIADNISGSGNIRFEALNTKTGSLETTNTTQNARLNTIEVKSGSIDTAITALGTESGSVKTRLNTIEAATGSYALKTQISGSFTAVSASFATTIGSLTSDYTELTNVPANIVSSSAQIGTDISGSLSAAAIVALGAGILSGSSADGAISSSAQIVNLGANIVSGAAQIVTLTSHTEAFSSATAVTASHGLGTKNVTVSVYTNDDFMIFPTSIKTHDTNNVYVSFNSSRTGRVVITK